MYKTFNKKRYRIWSWHFTKDDAQQQAKRLRKIGWLARVVTIPALSVGLPSIRYEVYTYKGDKK